MKRNLFSPPEPFSLSPMLSLLPIRGSVSKLETLTSSLFARFEKVAALSEAGDRKESPEAQMLRQVLDWLAVKPDSEGR